MSLVVSAALKEEELRREAAERQERALWARQQEEVDRVLATLRGRRDMNLGTSRLHPDEAVRRAAAARAEAYGMAILDVASLRDEARR